MNFRAFCFSSSLNVFYLWSSSRVFSNWILIVELFTMFDRLPYIIGGQISIYFTNPYSIQDYFTSCFLAQEVFPSSLVLHQDESLMRWKVYTLDACSLCLAVLISCWWCIWRLLHFSLLPLAYSLFSEIISKFFHLCAPKCWVLPFLISTPCIQFLL